MGRRACSSLWFFSRRPENKFQYFSVLCRGDEEGSITSVCTMCVSASILILVLNGRQINDWRLIQLDAQQFEINCVQWEREMIFETPTDRTTTDDDAAAKDTNNRKKIEIWNKEKAKLFVFLFISFAFIPLTRAAEYVVVEHQFKFLFFHSCAVRLSEYKLTFSVFARNCQCGDFCYTSATQRSNEKQIGLTHHVPRSFPFLVFLFRRKIWFHSTSTRITVSSVRHRHRIHSSSSFYGWRCYFQSHMCTVQCTRVNFIFGQSSIP